jgi:hypothetical protein
MFKNVVFRSRIGSFARFKYVVWCYEHESGFNRCYHEPSMEWLCIGRKYVKLFNLKETGVMWVKNTALSKAPKLTSRYLCGTNQRKEMNRVLPLKETMQMKM